MHMPPRRSTRSSTRLSTEPDSNPQAQKQAPSSKRKRSTADNTDIDGQEGHGKPPSRTSRRSSTKATASVPAPRASSRLKGTPRDPDGEDEDGEPLRRTKRSRPALDSIDDVDEGEIEVPTTSQRKTTNRSRRVNSLTSPQTVVKEDDTAIGENATVIVSNGDVANVLAEESTPVPSPKKLPSNTPPVYEEKSLLDNLPTSPSKAIRPPLPLEDPQGPKPRLVIHKLVLVNFKSYAGCQEIGPFHRVGCFLCRNIKLISCSLSQRSSDLMVQASRILLMRYFLCLGTAPAR